MVVYDILGRTVRTLVRGDMEGGPHRVVWDGRDDAGIPAGSGVYLIRLEVGQAAMTRRALLLK